jgi:hypothetical protein
MVSHVFGAGFLKYPPTKRKTLKLLSNPVRIQSGAFLGLISISLDLNGFGKPIKSSTKAHNG